MTSKSIDWFVSVLVGVIETIIVFAGTYGSLKLFSWLETFATWKLYALLFVILCVVVSLLNRMVLFRHDS